VPELWPGVLDELAKMAGARVGWLCVSKGAIQHWDASLAEAKEVLGLLFARGKVPKFERFTRLLAARHAGFLTDLDIYTEAELELDPTNRDIMRPRGLVE